jgi:hypothetical protein
MGLLLSEECCLPTSKNGEERGVTIILLWYDDDDEMALAWDSPGQQEMDGCNARRMQSNV